MTSNRLLEVRERIGTITKREEALRVERDALRAEVARASDGNMIAAQQLAAVRAQLASVRARIQRMKADDP